MQALAEAVYREKKHKYDISFRDTHEVLTVQVKEGLRAELKTKRHLFKQASVMAALMEDIGRTCKRSRE